MLAYGNEPAGSKQKERVENASLAREHICLMSESVSAQAPSRFAASLLGTIVGDDVGSRFFWELVDKALWMPHLVQSHLDRQDAPAPIGGPSMRPAARSMGGRSRPTL